MVEDRLVPTRARPSSRPRTTASGMGRGRAPRPTRGTPNVPEHSSLSSRGARETDASLVPDHSCNAPTSSSARFDASGIPTRMRSGHTCQYEVLVHVSGASERHAVQPRAPPPKRCDHVGAPHRLEPRRRLVLVTVPPTSAALSDELAEVPAANHVMPSAASFASLERGPSRAPLVLRSSGSSRRLPLQSSLL